MGKLINKKLSYYYYKTNRAILEYTYDDRVEIVDFLYYRPTFRDLFIYPLSLGYREIKIVWYTYSKVREQFASFNDFLNDCIYLMEFDRERYVTENNRVKFKAVREFINDYYVK